MVALLNATNMDLLKNNLSETNKTMGLSFYATDQALAHVELFRDYPDWLLHFAFACCIIFMIIGIPGNLITIIALARCKKVRNATAMFIINLACSDLLFCCFNLPLAASTFWSQSWTHGKVLCRMFPWARYALVAVSLFTVLSITINRYIMISHPSIYLKVYSKRNITLMIAAIWLFSFGSLSATFFESWGQFSLDPTVGSCTIIADVHGVSPKEEIFIVAFILPSVAIIVCYARIIWIVRKTAKKSRRPTIAPPPTVLPITALSSDASGSTTTNPKTLHISGPRKFAKSCNFNCFIHPEFSTSNNESSQDEPPKTYESTMSLSTIRGDGAQRFRKSFIATFRRSTAQIKPRLPTKKDKRLLTLIVAIMVSFFVCHLPITLTKTIFPSTSHPYANISGYVLIYLTTCINPIIYVVMSSEYRKAYKNLFMCR